MPSSAEARNLLVERLVGDTGEPDHVREAAQALALRVIPAIAAELNDTLSFPVEMEIDRVEIGRFAQARPLGGGHDAMVIVPSASSPDALAMVADAKLIALLVSALFGGDPDAAPAPITRKLSAIELELASKLFDMAARVFNGSGDRALDLHFPLPRPVTGAEIEKLVVRDGPAAKIVFRIASPGGSGELVVTMPQRVLLTHRSEGKPAATPSAWRAKFNEEVMRSRVTLEATVPMPRMTLGEVAKLKAGQVLELPADAQADTRLSARRKTLFVCEFGKLGNHFTVRIQHPYDAGKEFMDGLVS